MIIYFGQNKCDVFADFI